MGKHEKHEEHVNHERWLVSFADMMTLLFALFVVLYALSSVKIEKVRLLKQSVQFAFHIAGDGKTKDDGIFEKLRGGGDTPLPVPLMNAQDGAMREFVSEMLPQLEEVVGKSLEIVQKDDTVSARWPVSAFFEPLRYQPIKSDAFNSLIVVAQGSLTFTSDIRIVIEAPDVILGVDAAGRPVTSLELCWRRLLTLRKALVAIPEVRPEIVRIELAQQREQPAAGVAADWEARAQVILAFSNMRAEGR